VQNRDSDGLNIKTLTDLWRDVHGGLRAFIAKRVENEAEVDDLLQEVFLRMHRGLDRLEKPDRVVAWLYQIARNVIVDHYRSPIRRREHPSGLASDLETGVAHVAERKEESGVHDSRQVKTELAACLRPMIDRLADEYRTAVTMVELDGLTQKAAAERVGLSLSGMKSRVQRGRLQLRQMLEACCRIELDGRHSPVEYEVRDAGCDRSLRSKQD